MGSTPEELNTEIAGTRESLATDLDALQDRVSPQAVLDRRKAAVRSRAQGLRSRVMGSDDSSSGGLSSAGSSAVDTAQHKVEGSPLAAGMVAFFAGVLVSAAIPATRTESRLSQKAVDTAKEHGQPAADAMKSAGQDMAEGLKDSAQQAVQEVKSSTQQSAQRVQEEGRSSAEEVRAQSQSSQSDSQSTYQSQSRVGRRSTCPATRPRAAGHVVVPARCA